MRSVLVDQDARLVVVIVSVAADVRTLVDDQHFFAGHGRQALGEHGTGKSSTYHQVIKHSGSFRGHADAGAPVVSAAAAVKVTVPRARRGCRAATASEMIADMACQVAFHDRRER